MEGACFTLLLARPVPSEPPLLCVSSLSAASICPWLMPMALALLGAHPELTFSAPLQGPTCVCRQLSPPNTRFFQLGPSWETQTRLSPLGDPAHSLCR